MADTILEPSVVQPMATEDTSTYLVKENYLSEFETEDEKSVVRANLGVYGQETVYTQDEAQLMVNEKIHAALQNYVTSDELPAAIAELSEQIADAGYVKSDGSVPFTSPQTQSSLPTQDYHLANKSYVDNLMKSHLNAYDPHGTLDQVNVLLADYAKLSDTYTTAKLYTQKEIDNLLSYYVKKDGSVSFTNPVSGVDPTLASHLATMRYVKLVMQNHESDADPHGIKETLKKTLSNYYTKSETYTKAQTYSRTQLLDIIKDQMEDVVKQAIADWEATEGSVSDLREWVTKKLYECVKADGSVTHTKPQGGVAAESSNDFVILSQLEAEVNAAVDEIMTEFAGAVWVTSGPVEATVGKVEEGTAVPSTMTLQQVCDAIFYGKQTSVGAPDYASYGDSVCITLNTHGTGTLAEADIYKNGTFVGAVYPEDFTIGEDGSCYYVWCDTDAFTEDTEWKVEFIYSDGDTVSDSKTTKLSYPIFIGLIPYWWNVQEDVTFDSLYALAEKDPDNNGFYNLYGPDVESLDATYSFTDASKRSIIVVLPNDYPDLLTMVTPTQTVTYKAFAKWIQPMYPASVEVGVSYKIYVYKQPLVQLDQTVTFTFGTIDEE